MRPLDWIVVAAYLVGTLALGVLLARRGAKSFAEFFVGGRAIPWWLAGASMAATTFNVDTPLYVTGVVARRGIAGNWEWWSFAFTHVLMAVVLARLWRRAMIMTDVELIELRYGGKPAAILRGTRALLFAIPINCVGIGYGMLAMRKVRDRMIELEDFNEALDLLRNIIKMQDQLREQTQQRQKQKIHELLKD